MMSRHDPPISERDEELSSGCWLLLAVAGFCWLLLIVVAVVEVVNKLQLVVGS